jgi:sulfite exporter TauE/SafE
LDHRHHQHPEQQTPGHQLPGEESRSILDSIIDTLNSWMHSFHGALPDQIEPLTIAGFTALLSFSFVASLHCATMCAPLVSAKLGSRALLRSRSIWLYNSGRGLSYVSAGAILATLHSQAVGWFPVLGSWLARILGAAIIIASFLVLFQNNGRRLPRFVEHLSQFIGRTIANVTRKFTHQQQDFALGLATVFLPCMTLAPALAAAAATASAFGGSILMFAFFLGTLPVMVVAPAVPLKMAVVIPQTIVRALTFAFLFLVGLLTLFRGLT